MNDFLDLLFEAFWEVIAFVVVSIGLVILFVYLFLKSVLHKF